mgnify:CR=1 FL=1
MLRIVLPFPDPRLSPNRATGHHYGATSAIKKAVRHFAYAETKKALEGRFTSLACDSVDIPVTITFVQPDKRRRDRDNLLFACKSALDGIADALGINDVCFEPLLIKRIYGEKPGETRIEIG